MANYPKRPRYTTPMGTAVYPHLHAPDTKFDAAGTYSTKVRFEGAAATSIQAFLDEQYKLSQEEAAEALVEAGKAASIAAARKKVKAGPEPYTEELDEDGNETGAIIVNFKMTASGVSKKTGKAWERKPRLFDAQGQAIPLGLKIGSGSQLKIATEVNRYYTAALGAGVSLRLEAVQVITLQTWGGMTAEQAGFDAVEGGFSVADADDSAFAGVAAPSPSPFEDDDDDGEVGPDGDF